MPLARRTLLAAPLLLPAHARAAPDPLAAIEARHGGRLGVFAIETGSGRTLAHSADARFLMHSTFKAMLAALVLARVDAGQDRLDALVGYSASDLLPVSPVAEAHVAAGRLSVAALCAAVLTWSDNTAANLLLRRVNGPVQLTAFARRLGDAVTRFDRYEPVGGWDGIRDTTTPRAFAGLVRRVVLGDALSPASRGLLTDWMVGCAVGQHRLRAGLPPGWRAADRTGTGGGAVPLGCNDTAVIWPPGRPPLVVASCYDRATGDLAMQEAVLHAVGAAVAAWSAGPA